MTKDQMKRIMHQLMQGQSNGRSLQIFELITAINRATGLSIDNYRGTLGGVLEELEQKQYIRCAGTGNKMPIFFRGLEFDKWGEELGSQNSGGGTNGNNFIFNGAVGSVQTGTNAVSNVVQTFGGPDKGKLIEALRELQKDLASAIISEPTRTDLSEIAGETIVELNKDRPNQIKLTSSLNTIAQSIQTAASVLPAYQLLKVALTPFGISLP
ncbi:hypothetical protein [Paraburkholderia domus]|jgi:hypothetical protein|uniref:hypothetical protein n=1 Tax=Paraburkholderia domus TaxID=2793075 RepID=UPI001914B87E|nr:hypothetical protein [Paraburkholderia domus]MBK5186114.1 hypothetical protein [Burkholderia sp. R-69749]MCI0150211.1 hypothetical protein [Paraburkholderia sediminicola]CAE6900272.1 hypothetical protein R69749_08108 [Paraburkholderia domus]